MPRLSVYVPAELADTMRARLPHINVSEVLQEGLRARLDCRHHELACRACSVPIDAARIAGDALGKFYRDLLWDLDNLVSRGGTAEGAARIAKDVACRHRVPGAATQPLPRPTRAERLAAKVKPITKPERKTA